MKWLCWKIIKMIKWLWNKRQLESWTLEIGTITSCGPEKYRFTYYTCGSISAPIISSQSSYPSFHSTNTNHPHKYRQRLSHTGNWIKYLYWAQSQYTVNWQSRVTRSQDTSKLGSVLVVADTPPTNTHHPPPDFETIFRSLSLTLVKNLISSEKSQPTFRSKSLFCQFTT